MNVRFEDLELLDRVQQFTLTHPHPALQRFAKSMRDWGDEWIAVAQNYLPAADFLGEAIADTNRQTRALVEIFERHKHRLRWEQSYRKADAVVPEAMLEGYAFAEIIGKQGPFVSDRIRAGVGIWGPDILYPLHQHQAEEVYVVLSGAAQFKIGSTEATERTTGDVVHVESNTRHGFRTADQTLVVYYLWQDGDLRQTSIFG